MYFTAENGIVWGRKCHDIVLDSDAKNGLQLFVSLRMYRLNQWPSFIWAFWINILNHICPRGTSISERKDTPPFMFTNYYYFTHMQLECAKYSLSFYTIYSYPIKMIQEQLYTVVNMVIKIRIISWKSFRTDKKYSDKENENKALRCWAIFTRLNNNEIGHSISMNGSSNLRAMWNFWM